MRSGDLDSVVSAVICGIDYKRRTIRYWVAIFALLPLLLGIGGLAIAEATTEHISGRGVVYLRTVEQQDPKTGAKVKVGYVGQAIDWDRFTDRMKEHQAKLARKTGGGATYEFEVLSRPRQTELDVTEEAWIRKLGSIESEGGALQNRRHQLRDFDEERARRIREDKFDRIEREQQSLDRLTRRRISEERLESSRARIDQRSELAKEERVAKEKAQKAQVQQREQESRRQDQRERDQRAQRERMEREARLRRPNDSHTQGFMRGGR